MLNPVLCCGVLFDNTFGAVHASIVGEVFGTCHLPHVRLRASPQIPCNYFGVLKYRCMRVGVLLAILTRCNLMQMYDIIFSRALMRSRAPDTPTTEVLASLSEVYSLVVKNARTLASISHLNCKSL